MEQSQWLILNGPLLTIGMYALIAKVKAGFVKTTQIGRGKAVIVARALERLALSVTRHAAD